jgi:hypothetical protein
MRTTPRSSGRTVPARKNAAELRMTASARAKAVLGYAITDQSSVNGTCRDFRSEKAGNCLYYLAVLLYPPEYRSRRVSATLGAHASGAPAVLSVLTMESTEVQTAFRSLFVARSATSCNCFILSPGFACTVDLYSRVAPFARTISSVRFRQYATNAIIACSRIENTALSTLQSVISIDPY